MSSDKTDLGTSEILVTEEIFKNAAKTKSTQELLPVIIQDYNSKQVLMLGYMNFEAFQKTVQTGHVTFFSRSKNRLWTKGETSGNFLNFKKYFLDCDNDAILVLAEPQGPTCHTGNNTCFFKEG